MLSVCGVREDQMPKVYESYEAVGTLKHEIAVELGLSDRVKVAAGAGDNAAAAVGTGTVGEGCCNISIGTSGTVFIASNQFSVDKNNALHAFAHADGYYHLMGCILSAGSCSRWWHDILGLSEYKFSEEEFTPEKLGSNLTYFLPYLMGERSPHNDPSARGTFIGMSMDTTRADMTQAVLEGVAFAIRDSIEVARSLGISIERSKICGGGARSSLWRKIFANVLDLELDMVNSEDGPCFGGAMLAAVACGEYENVEQCVQKVVKVVHTVKPDPAVVSRYEERYQKFRKIYPALQTLFSDL